MKSADKGLSQSKPLVVASLGIAFPVIVTGATNQRESNKLLIK